MTRYEWKEMPDNYNANYYNNEDLKLGRTFVIVDTKYGLEYVFPTYQYKKNRYGNEVKTNVIDSNLWNQEFFNWICSTAPDFCCRIPEEFMTNELIDICIENTSHDDFIREISHLTQDMCIKFIKRFPKAIREVPKYFINEEMVIDAINGNPELIKSIPDTKLTSDICKLCYELADIKLRQYLLNQGYMKDQVSKEMFNELLDNNLSVNLREIPEKFITEDLAHSLFEKNIDYICQIPDKYKTYEMCLLAVKKSSHYIAFVPKELQKIELIKMALNDDWRKISSINVEVLTDEIIEYAINKNGLAISGIPKERRIKEFCDLAVKKNVKAFRFIPDQFKTIDICRYCIMIDPNLIKCIPPEVITQEFFDEIKKFNIVISNRNMLFMKECVNKNNEFTKLLQPKEEIIEENIFEEYKNITIESLRIFFSPAVVNILKKMNIKTLEELFIFSSKPEFISVCYSSKFRDEIIGTIKILKCKYLNINPEIDIYNEDKSFKEYAHILGLSKRAMNALARSGWSSYSFKEFIEEMNKDDSDYRLSNVRNLGEYSKTEILLKVRIITDYYSKRVKKKNITKVDESNSDLSNIKKLYEELKELLEERKKLECKIDFIVEQLGNDIEQNDYVKKLIK